MALRAPTTHRWFMRIFLGAILAFTLLAFVGVSIVSAQDCAAAKSKKTGCAVKSCAAKTTCASAVSATATGEKKPCTKEECIAKCMAQGMTKEQAEACWAKHAEGKAGPCPADSSMSFAAGCPLRVTMATATGDAKPCTKEKCVAKLMASGMSKEDAEKKAETCMASGKCTGTHEAGKGCCAFNKDKKSGK